MSLVGSLEDLALADILQIVSLSRKSGTLMLRSESGDGRIVLRNGLVHGAAIKGEPEDLRGLLLAHGCVDAQGFDRARSVAGAESLALEEALQRECGLPPDRLASVRRAHVERSVIRMFGWRSGEFSFEIRDDLSADDRELLLPSGLNSQYLAIEATRLGDESASSGGAPRAEAADEVDGADVAEPVFSGEESAAAAPERLPAAAVESLALGAARRAEPAAGVVAAEPVTAPAEPADVVIAGRASGPTPVAVSVLPVLAELPGASAGHLVAIDSDLSSLEWLKASLHGLCRRVHIFQHRDAAFERIRQYLMRGIVPTVVLSEATSDRRGSHTPTFVRRLRAIAPSMPILALRPEHAGDRVPSGSDGVVFRPDAPTADPKRWHSYRALAARLRSDLEPWLRGDPKVSAPRRAIGALAQLKGVRERLRDPSTQGEVMTLVLDCAGETFERVAMFIMREDVAIGKAQRGLESTGGPDDKGMHAIKLGPDAMPELFEEVLARRTPRRAKIRRPRERDLAARLGAEAAPEAYAAPIERGGRVAALIYADNLPDERPLPDTTAFESVLREAGLVLDRALLALAERS
jgi:hypothetical protein